MKLVLLSSFLFFSLNSYGASFDFKEKVRPYIEKYFGEERANDLLGSSPSHIELPKMENNNILYRLSELHKNIDENKENEVKWNEKTIKYNKNIIINKHKSMSSHFLFVFDVFCLVYETKFQRNQLNHQNLLQNSQICFKKYFSNIYFGTFGYSFSNYLNFDCFV